MIFAGRLEIGAFFGVRGKDEASVAVALGLGRETEDFAEPPVTLGRTEEKGFLDGGNTGPLDELLEELFGGFLLGLVETPCLEVNAAGVEVATAEANDVLGKDTQGFALFFKFGGVQLLAVHEGLGVVEGEEAEEGIGEAIGGVGEFAGVGGEIAGLLEDLLVT